MGCVVSLVSIFSVIALFQAGNSGAAVAAIVVGVAQLWSYGVMHNFATDAYVARVGRETAERDGSPFFSFSPEDADAVPDGIASINMLCCLAVLVFAIWGGVAWATSG